MQQMSQLRSPLSREILMHTFAPFLPPFFDFGGLVVLSVLAAFDARVLGPASSADLFVPV